MPISGGPTGGDQLGVPLRLSSKGPDLPYWAGVGVSLAAHGCVLAYVLFHSLLELPGASQQASTPISIELVDTRVFESRMQVEHIETASTVSAVPGDTVEQTQVVAADDRHPLDVSPPETTTSPDDSTTTPPDDVTANPREDVTANPRDDATTAPPADTKVEPASEPVADTQQPEPAVEQPLLLPTTPEPQEAEQSPQQNEEATPEPAPEAAEAKKVEEGAVEAKKAEEKPAPDVSQRQQPAPSYKPKQNADDTRKERRKGRGTTASVAASGSGQSNAAAGQVSASRGQALAYWSRVQAHLAANKPNGGMGRGTVKVAFAVSSSGRLVAAHISRSSGNPALDQAALGAVRNASPYPQPPAGMSAAQLRFSFPFYFQ